jgi:hypothetical protein
MPIDPLDAQKKKARASLVYLRAFLEDELDRRRDSQISEYIKQAEKAVGAVEDLERIHHI